MIRPPAHLVFLLQLRIPVKLGYAFDLRPCDMSQGLPIQQRARKAIRHEHTVRGMPWHSGCTHFTVTPQSGCSDCTPTRTCRRARAQLSSNGEMRESARGTTGAACRPRYAQRPSGSWPCTSCKTPAKTASTVQQATNRTARVTSLAGAAVAHGSNPDPTWPHVAHVGHIPPQCSSSASWQLCNSTTNAAGSECAHARRGILSVIHRCMFTQQLCAPKGPLDDDLMTLQEPRGARTFV